MPVEIRIPKFGVSMDEAVLSEWLALDGSHIASGAPLYSVETDKSTQEVEAPASGTLRIIGVEGESYPVGHLIGTLE